LEIVAACLRGVHVAALLSLFGCLVFRHFVVPSRGAGVPGDEGVPLAAVDRIGLVSAWLGLIFGVGWLAAVSGTIASASGYWAALNAVPAVVRHTGFGNFLCARLLLLTGVLALLSSRARGLALTCALTGAGAAVAVQPLLGHLGASGGRDVLMPIEVAHLLAAGAWLGSLLPLFVCVMRAPAPMGALLCKRFTPVGLVAVGTIALTALPQAGELIGNLPGLFGTTYGHLALIKTGLFFLALGLACVNRLVLTGHASGRRALIASIAVEAVAVFGVVLAAAAMASSVPAVHVQPDWPFSWRPSLEAWDDPESRRRLARVFIATAAGVALIGVSQVVRRFRVFAAGLAMLMFAALAPALDLLVVEAYPTSYARSPSGFSVDSIVRGRALFQERCAVCHERQAGTGGEADLTAPHIWGHLDGELFWWLTNGVQNGEGSALMPAFGSVLTENDRWALIDFIRARNVGRQNAETGHWSPPVAAPSTPLSCADADADADAIADLTGRVLVVAAAGESGPGAGGVSGAVTIRLARGATEPPKAGECVTASADGWEAWRAVSGIAPDRFAGYRAIVDGRGWLRAWLPPGSGLEQVAAAVRDARDHPIAAGARPAGGHRH
jgi:putative copper export protein/mono/diheme cytochrome c family protein